MNSVNLCLQIVNYKAGIKIAGNRGNKQKYSREGK
jgi:hypothetical protein